MKKEVQDLIYYVYSQDLAGNVEYLPAKGKKLFIKTLFKEILIDKMDGIIVDNNNRIDYQIERFNELVNLINSPDPFVYLRSIL